MTTLPHATGVMLLLSSVLGFSWRAAAISTLLLISLVASPTIAQSSPNCPCLEHGGSPGPGPCLCDTGGCYLRCVNELCPDTPNCTVECSLRCFCFDNESVGCPTHEDPGPTPTVVHPRTPTAAPTNACVGDCNGDGSVTINELITGVNVDLGNESADACPALACNTGPLVYIDCLVLAVNNALDGCRLSAHPTGTPTPSSTPPATAAGSPMATLTPPEPTATATVGTSPTGGTGFTIEGCVFEFPNECGQIGFTVRLDPLGLTDSSPDFRFTNIPPGDYVLSVDQRCNPFGCWKAVPVTITDHDVYVDIPLIPNPTATPLKEAPTTTPSATPTADPLLAAIRAPWGSACVPPPVSIGSYVAGYQVDDGYGLVCERSAGHGNNTMLRRYPSTVAAAGAFSAASMGFDPLALDGVPAASRENPFPPGGDLGGREVVVLWQLECWVARVDSYDDTDFRIAPDPVALSRAILASAGNLLLADCGVAPNSL